jgi:adenylate cyclase
VPLPIRSLPEHGGRIVKTTGDGMLVEFPSVVGAVQCAVTLQKLMAERNAGVSVERRMDWRIGVHLGDLLIDGDDILGDGVNLAARLEGIAEPGGICISEDAFRQVQGKIETEFLDSGEQALKNIARPVRIYRAQPASAPVLSVPAPTAFVLPDKPSIAVLPFQNMSGDPEQEYFVDGMVEEIIAALSRIRWLFVIARNSTFTYKGRAVDVKQVGRELGVRYVLEGSARGVHAVQEVEDLVKTRSSPGASSRLQRCHTRSCRSHISRDPAGQIEGSSRSREVIRIGGC